MTRAQDNNETARWTAEGHSITIEYPIALMDQIRTAVIEGFYRISRGGVEVGGVLFGVRDGDLIRIEAVRPLACEYASGPSFVLSENDEEALRKLLEAAGSDAELSGLAPVGWYHSHTRSEISLSDRDMEVYNRFFPEPWQVSLILRPERIKPTRAGFFFREPDGSVRMESSYREFAVEPSAKKRTPPSRPTEEEDVGFPVSVEPEYPWQGRSRRWVDWMLFTLALFSMLAGAGLLVMARWFSEPPEPVSLQLLDADGQLQVQWNHSAKAIQEARSGALEIIDGEKRTWLELDGAQLRRGSVTYARRSGTVHAGIRVRRAGAEPEEAFARFVGEPVANASQTVAADVQRERDELVQEVQQLRTELDKLNARNRQLEAAMKALQGRRRPAQ